MDGASAKIHRVAAFKSDSGDMLTALSRLTDLASVGAQRGQIDKVIGSPFRQSQVSAGDVANNGTAMVRFGAEEIRARVAATASAGATSLSLDRQLPPGTVVEINPGLTGS